MASAALSNSVMSALQSPLPTLLSFDCHHRSHPGPFLVFPRLLIDPPFSFGSARAWDDGEDDDNGDGEEDSGGVIATLFAATFAAAPVTLGSDAGNIGVGVCVTVGLGILGGGIGGGGG